MTKESMEDRLIALETKIKGLEKLIKQLPKLPKCDCGFVLMGCEHGDKPNPHHMQCYACGSYWDVKGDPFKDGHKGPLADGVIPDNRSKAKKTRRKTLENR